MSSLNYVNSQELDQQLYKYTKSYSEEIKKILVKQGHTRKKLDKLTHSELRQVYRDLEDKPPIHAEMSEELGEMFLKVANNISNRRNFARYTYKDDLIGLGLEHLCKYAHNFDIEYPITQSEKYIKFANKIMKKAESKGGLPAGLVCMGYKCKKEITIKNYKKHVKEMKKEAEVILSRRLNSFAYVSQICMNGFAQAIKEEKKQSAIKNGIIQRNAGISELDKWNASEDGM
jgi:hypothetical protein